MKLRKIVITTFLLLFLSLSGTAYIVYQHYEESRWRRIIAEKESEGWKADEVFGVPGKFKDWYFVHVSRGTAFSSGVISEGRVVQTINVSPIPPKQEALVAVFQKQGFDFFVVVLR